MKKTISIFCCLSIVVGFLLAGCGSQPVASPTPPESGSVEDTATPPPETPAPQPPTPQETLPPDDGDTDTPGGTGGNMLQLIVDQAQDQIEGMQDAFGGILDMTITARDGNKLVYTYTLHSGILDMDTETIEKSVSGMEEAMTAVVTLLETVGVKDAAVIIEWFDAEGNEMYSKEYK